MTEYTDPRLYILMRTDMASMNSGKGMAQAAHAANAFVYDIKSSIEKPYGFKEWEESTPQGFGTTITLEVSGEVEMQKYVDLAKSNGYIAGMVHDPSYPVTDGSFLHLLPINTCAYIFLPDPTVYLKDGEHSFTKGLSRLSLHS